MLGGHRQFRRQARQAKSRGSDRDSVQLSVVEQGAENELHGWWEVNPLVE